jgi:hypothetical protein
VLNLGAMKCRIHLSGGRGTLASSLSTPSRCRNADRLRVDEVHDRRLVEAGSVTPSARLDEVSGPAPGSRFAGRLLTVSAKAASRVDGRRAEHAHPA